jgi:hypothetical protein
VLPPTRSPCSISLLLLLRRCRAVCPRANDGHRVVYSSRPVTRLGRRIASIPPACAWSRLVGE